MEVLLLPAWQCAVSPMPHMSYGNGVPMMENLTQLERLFIELLRTLDEQGKEDLMRLLEVLSQSAE